MTEEIVDYTKGGRGKNAPYRTEMYRIPTIMKSEVQRVSAIVKELYAIGGVEAAALFLLELSDRIGEADRQTRVRLEGDKSVLEHQPSAPSSTPAQDKLSAVEAMVDSYRQRTKDTRNWVEANRLINDLLSILL